MWNLFEVNNKDTGRHQLSRSHVFIINFEQLLHIAPVFSLTTLDM